MKTTAYIGISLDGFIARTDGGIDWLTAPAFAPGGADGDYGFGEFMKTVDALVMGRNTYDVVRSMSDSWYYGDTPVVVLTTRPVDIPPNLAGTVEAMSGTPADVIRRLEERGAAHLYIDGGRTIQSFLDAGLLQRMVITRLPILIGSGVPLFGPVPHDVLLHHTGTRMFSNGLVQSEYEVRGID